jgi:hypothetical protein
VRRCRPAGRSWRMFLYLRQTVLTVQWYSTRALPGHGKKGNAACSRCRGFADLKVKGPGTVWPGDPPIVPADARPTGELGTYEPMLLVF